MIDRGHELPLTRQAALLRLGRSSLYYAPRPVPAGELAVMRRIDELHLNYPFAFCAPRISSSAARRSPH